MDQKCIQEDLSVIKRIMEDSRENLYNYGINLVVWGALVIFALLLTWYNIEVNFLLPNYWYWILAFGSGFVFEYTYGRRVLSRMPVMQLSGQIGSTLWLAILVTMVLFGVFGTITGVLTPESIGAGIAGLLAVGYLVTGEIIGVPWVKRLGYGWWIGVVALLYSSDSTHILIMAFLMFVLQFIPGVILLMRGPMND